MQAWVAGCVAVLGVACTAPVDASLSVEDDADGYVMLDEPARGQGFLHVEGVCRPLDAELPEAVSSTERSALVSTDFERRIDLDVAPERILLVHGMDDPPELLEIDRDLVLVEANDARAVAWLASAIFADATLLRGVGEDPPLTRWLLRGPDVWEKSMRAWQDPALEIPEGIASLHPAPEGMSALQRAAPASLR